MMSEDRPYQKEAIDFLIRSGKGIIRGPTGCGKTHIALRAAVEIGWSRLLIIVPRYSALLTWKRELQNFGIPHTIVKKWVPKKRKEFWQYPVNKPNTNATTNSIGSIGSTGSIGFVEPETRVVVALYATIARDVDTIAGLKQWQEFDFIIGDECHRIKDRKSVSSKATKRIARGKKVLFLSASLQSHGPENLWAALNITNHAAFPSYFKFINKYCVLEDDGFGSKIVGTKESALKALRKAVKPYICNISSKSVVGYVPQRNRQKLYVELPKRVKKVYDIIWSESMLALPGSAPLLAPGTLAKLMALRKLLTCPELIHDAFDVGAGVKAVWEHALGERPIPHIVLFSDFKEPFPLWAAWFKEQGVTCEIIQGGVSDTELAIRIDRFSRLAGVKPSVLMCTIPYAESFDLLSPQDAYFLGWSWSQIANYQAEGRLTRGTKEYANFFYCVHSGTVEDHMLNVVNGKEANTSLVAGDIEDYRDGYED